MKKKFYEKLIKIPLLYRFYLTVIKKSKSSQQLLLKYKLKDLNVDYYNKVKNDRELEHQIGRLKNIKLIIRKCKNLEGDFIEFGSWKGFSLLWIAYFMEITGLFNHKLIGIDGFVGLPYSDGVFTKYDFADTSYDECRQNIYDSKELLVKTKKNIFIAKFLYNKKRDIIDYINSIKIKKFCFIHIDCDVSKSLEEVFEILIDGNLIADKAFILFDDYYCKSNFKKTADKILLRLKKNWNIKAYSKTKLTKYYYFSKKSI